MKGWVLNRIPQIAEARIAVPLLIVIATLLRLPNLDESFWYDEVVYSTRFLASNLSYLWQLLLIDTPAPLYRIVMYVWVRVFGENEVVVRLPSLVCGVGAILLTYAIARRYGSKQIALLAALFLCFSPVQVWYSQEAVGYTMTMCLLLAAVLTWQYLKLGMRAWYWYLIYGLVLWGAIFTHYLTAVFLLPLTLMALTAIQPVRIRIVAINFLIGALTVGALIAKSKLGVLLLGLSFLRPFTLFEWWMLFFNWFLHGNSIWTLFPYGATPRDLLNSPLLLACQIFFLFILVRGLKPSPGQAWLGHSLEITLFLCSLPLTFFLLTLVGYDRMYIERYLVIGLPFFALAIARGATEFSNVRVSRTCATITLMLGVISYALFLSKGEVWTVYKQNPDMRSAAGYLVAQIHSSDKAMLILPTGRADLVYYLNKQSPQGHPPVEKDAPAALERAVATGKLREIFLINNRYWEGNFPVVYRRLNSEPRFEMVNMRSFKGVDIYTFVPK